jgi:hypothetical protein
MESVDKTLFTFKHDTDFLLVQIYVDDIIFYIFLTLLYLDIRK